jgi:hypothetical protein
MDAYPVLTRGHAVTSGASPPSPSALCGHHGAILGTTAPSLMSLKHVATGHHHARCCAPYSLPSAAPSNQHAGGHRTGDLYATTLEAAPGRIQGAP